MMCRNVWALMCRAGGAAAVLALSLLAPALAEAAPIVAQGTSQVNPGPLVPPIMFVLLVGLIGVVVGIFAFIAVRDASR